ncbi:MAG: protein kinase [Planctomycetota bacterium]
MIVCDSCPTPLQLKQLLEDQLSEDVAARLTEQIAGCKLCQEKLQSVVASQRLIDRLGALRDDSPDSGELDRAVIALKSLLPSPIDRSGDPVDASKSGDANVDREFLEQDGYAILELIGMGGMGVVYKAWEKSLDRVVALKVLSPALANDPMARERFLREAKSAAAIVDEHVVTIHAVSGRLPHPYLVMEFVEGDSLQQMLDERDSISLEEVVRIGRQLAHGLQAAHSKGVIHRDIKPANILMHQESGKVQLTDFGLAHLFGDSRLTKSGVVIGTPGYFAPETIESGDTTDHRADLFSLGAVLYALCTGNSPFHSGSLLQSLRRLSTEKPAPLTDVNSTIPAWLSKIVLRLLEIAPDDRFNSAAEVSEALSDGVSHQTSSDSVRWEIAGASSSVSTASPRDVPTIKVPSEPRRSRRSRSYRPTLILSVVILALTGGWIFIHNATISRSPVETSVSEDIETGRIEPFESESPFWIVNEDSAEIAKYSSFEEAIKNALPKSRIEIHRTGPIPTRPCVLGDSEGSSSGQLDLVAGMDHRPILVFEPPAKGDVESMVEITKRVVIEGIELRLLPESLVQDFTLLALKSGGELGLRNCTLVVEAEGIAVYSEAVVRLENSDVVTPGGFGMRLEPGENAMTELRNCWFTGSTAVSILSSRSTDVVVQDCTIVCNHLFQVEESTSSQISPVGITVTRSILMSSDGILNARVNLKQRGFRWIGSQNVFAGVIESEGEPGTYDRTKALREFQIWQDRFEEVGSTYVTNPFEDDLENPFEFYIQPDFRISTLKPKPPITAGAKPNFTRARD